MASQTRLTCSQTPLAWPPSVAITDLPVCSGCAIRIDAPHSGSLQVTTRRAGDGVGDGVNVDEARNSVAVDYRGQRYTLMEAIFHTPGQHVFPGQSDVYPAEYHIHFQTFASPQRALTLVVPVSHQLTGPGSDYFAAVRAQPDPAATRPTLLSLFGSPTIDTIQFLAPDPRGRTTATPAPPATCAPTAMETMMALVLQPCQIRATDLERIPREGSLSSDPRDLPAQPRLQPTETVPRATLQAVAVLARPGIQVASVGFVGSALQDTSGASELECYPLEVRNGKDVIAMDGTSVSIESVLGRGARDVSGSGGLMSALLGGPNATPAEKQDALTLWTRISAGSAAFFLCMSIWFGLRQLLFTESTQKPVLFSFSMVTLVVLVVASVLAGGSV